MNTVTIFPNILNSKDPHYFTVEQVIERIKNSKHKDLITKIRNINDKRDRDVEKRKLPAICFSGKFAERNNEALLAHSGLIAIDFDHLPNVIKTKQEICCDEYTMLCFVSPSGDGLKVVCKIPADPKNHEGYSRALTTYYKAYAQVDFFKDVARVCYESSDPNIYYNPESLTFTDIEISKEPELKLTIGEVEKDSGKIFINLQKWIERKGEYYVDGNKHKFLVKLAAACNRFGLDKNFVTDMLIKEYANKETPVPDRDFLDIVYRVYKSYAATHATAFFDMEEKPYDIKNGVLDSSVFDVSLPARDIIYVRDVKDSMLEGFDNGYPTGTTTYYPTIDEHWKWKKGEVTLFHGIGNHGKTTILLWLMLLKSVFEGTKWGVFSPEQNPPNDFYDELIQMYIGKSTVKGNYQMSKQEYLTGLDFVSNYFYYCYPENDSPTPDYINSRFEELIYKHGIEGCLIDPFNQLENGWQETRDDKYISKFLSREKRFALKHDVYKLIIGHPKQLANNGKADYDCPKVYDLAGGAMWLNKCDNIIVIHRPTFTSDPTNRKVEFRSQKIKKQKLVGKPGMTEIEYLWTTGRYYVNGYDPLKQAEKQVSLI